MVLYCSYLNCVNGTMWWYVNQKSYNKKVCGFFSLRLKPCFMTHQTTFFVVFCENCVRVSNCRSTIQRISLSQVRLNMKTIKLHPNELQHKWCHPLQIFISELVNQQWFLGLQLICLWRLSGKNLQQSFKIQQMLLVSSFEFYFEFAFFVSIIYVSWGNLHFRKARCW